MRAVPSAARPIALRSFCSGPPQVDGLRWGCRQWSHRGRLHELAGRLEHRSGQLRRQVLRDALEQLLPPVLCELIGEPIKQSAKLVEEPIKGRVETGTSHSTACRAPAFGLEL